MSLSDKLKEMAKNENKLLSFLLKVYNHFPFNNRFKKHGNKIFAKCAMLKKCKITFIGKNNVLSIEKGCRLNHCNVTIIGNDNEIHLSEFVSANNADFYMEDNGNKILCGKHINFAGKIHLACTEGTSIIIKDDCLFSSDIVIRTGDSHSITDLSGNRINNAKDVVIGNHVWVGYRALINKGSEIADNSIVGTGAVVTKKFTDKNVILAGVPAKVVKENVNWINEKI